MKKIRFLSLAVAALFLFIPPVKALTHPLVRSSNPWAVQFSTNFPTPVQLGYFAGCDTSNNTCTYLPSSLQSTWWAYPYPWPDTATQRNYPVGGYYNPSKTVWISGNQMHIKMYRGTGPVNSAAVVPKVAMNRLYGRYVETVRVSQVTTGYKSAHLLWPSNGNQNTTSFEDDFPENEWDTTPYGFIHNSTNNQLSFSSNVSWSDWHTYTIDWWPGHVNLYVDGGLIGSTTDSAYVPNVNMDWIIQNESALNGESAPVNSSAQMDISYVEYDSYVG